jgi:hypothetical protein
MNESDAAKLSLLGLIIILLVVHFILFKCS